MIVEIAGLGSAGFVQRTDYAAPLPYAVPLLAIFIGYLSIAGIVEARVPAPLQRLADAIVARLERLQAA
jgi:hypothetical protein